MDAIWPRDESQFFRTPTTLSHCDRLVVRNIQRGKTHPVFGGQIESAISMLRPRSGQEDDAWKRIVIEQVGAEVRSRSPRNNWTQARICWICAPNWSPSTSSLVPQPGRPDVASAPVKNLLRIGTEATGT